MEKSNYKRTKVLAAIGPASHNYDTILAMVKAGMDGCRFNFSHGTHDERDQQIEWIRKAAKVTGKNVAILQDLQGPKIRLGDFDKHEIKVKAGDELHLTYGGEYDGDKVIPVQYDLSQKVEVGQRLYIFDGKVRTTIIGVEPKNVIVRVENDGILMKRKGINLPDTDFGGDILTKKDLSDIEFGAKQDFDYVALSFVQTAADIEKLKDLLKEHGSDAKVVAKVETKQAIAEENLEAIIMAADGVMVARGDLAVEVGAEVVPVAQRRILELAQKHGKMSIVATQMLISMVENPEPTRAEVSDVANAVIAGADCMMLSDETANGKLPLQVVKTMSRIIKYTQKHIAAQPLFYREEEADIQDAISSAAITLAHQVKASAIVCETKTGVTARSIAAHRPNMPIVSVTSDPRVAQQLNLLYANQSFLRPDGEFAGLQIAEELRENDFFDANSTVVIVSGRQPGLTGGTDTIRVRVLE